MSDKRRVVIPKERAVFWMDKNGEWFNAHGRFEHPRIIKYFNASIKKDENGYFVYQSTEEFEEKVYFRYAETALFAVDVRQTDGVLSIVLNTTACIGIVPEDLFVKDDNLYLQTKEDLIKFSSRALLKISKYIKEADGRMVFEFNGSATLLREE